MDIHLKRSIIEHFCWISILFILFFQSVLQNFSIISNVALLFFAIQQYPKMDNAKKRLTVITIIWLLFLAGYSVLQGNQVGLVIRFCLIIMFVISAYLWKIEHAFFLKALYRVSFLLVIGLIVLEAYMFSLSESEYMFLRDNFFIAKLKSNK